MNPFAGLFPESLWRHFADICAIPHGSRNEANIHRYILESARTLKMTVDEDKAGNICIRIPGRPGATNNSIVLQAHMDMVCEKNSDNNHDFSKDPIRPTIINGKIKAIGTSLGADNGIGMAMMLAILDEHNIFNHPPIELLFTSNEEIGLLGAGEIDQELITSRTMINLDTEDFGEIFIGCAGGLDSHLIYQPNWLDPHDMHFVKIAIRGLLGGHSGCDISKGKRNAIVLLSTVLNTLYREIPFVITSINAGSQRNAIPREAQIIIGIPKSCSMKTCSEIVRKQTEHFQLEFSRIEPNLTIEVVPLAVSHKTKTMSSESTRDFLALLSSLPNGLLNFSPDMPDLVETSTNIGVISTTDQKIEIGILSRSSVNSALLDLTLKIRTIAGAHGCVVEESGYYPGWKPNRDSKLLKIAIAVYERLFGSEPKVRAVHAGLECGIFATRFPDMDIISIGPTIRFPHSPDEELLISTVAQTYDYLKTLLSTLTQD